MNIKLVPIDKSNWEACAKLKVTEEQTHFVASNAYSVLQSFYEANEFPSGIYADDVMVGFVMYDYDPDDDTWGMCRLMVDHRHQKKGYGRAALKILLEMMRERHGHIRFYTSAVPQNDIAIKMYEEEGFKRTGEIDDGEVVLAIDL